MNLYKLITAIILYFLILYANTAYSQTFTDDFLELYVAYEVICETPYQAKTYLNYIDQIDYIDYSNEYDNEVKEFYWAATDGSYGTIYYDTVTETAWKYETKTYEPCFEGFILYLKSRE